MHRARDRPSPAREILPAMSRPRWLLVWSVLLLSATFSPAPAREAAPSDSGIDDAASMFSPEAVDRARSDLSRIERDQGIPVRIETVDSIRDQPIPDVE